MSALGIHHVGVAVRDLEAALARYERLFGARVEARERVEEQGVEALALLMGESGRVELLAPLAEDTPVGRFIARRGEGMHHLAFGVDDLPAALAHLRAAGATLIDEQPRTGIYGAVAFVHHESLGGVLSELVQATTVTEA
ncbi:MAG TPA: methylmalonyl-CoA epimerase [Gaiellales bacterium]|nr:methylmalonyl-CoA epimerase [Gaiellales bacterium]